MAEVKISELTSATTPLAGTETVPIVQGGVTKKVAVSEIGGGGGVTDVTATAPLSSTGGSTPDIAITQAGAADDGYLSTGDWNAFNNKQDGLISGTNIKTINGSSVLGSGNLTIGSSGLQGVHNLLGNQVSTSFGIMPCLNAGSLTNFSQTAGTLYLLPFIPNKTITSVSLKINIVVTGVGAIARILVYSDLNGFPNTKLYESANLDCSTSGIKTATTAFTFTAGTTYWLAVQVGTANITLSGITTGSLAPIFHFGFSAPYTGYYTSGLTMGNPPNPYAFYSYYNTSAPAIFISLS